MLINTTLTLKLTPSYQPSYHSFINPPYPPYPYQPSLSHLLNPRYSLLSTHVPPSYLPLLIPLNDPHYALFLNIRYLLLSTLVTPSYQPSVFSPINLHYSLFSTLVIPSYPSRLPFRYHTTTLPHLTFFLLPNKTLIRSYPCCRHG